jgi:hypothetical protein
MRGAHRQLQLLDINRARARNQRKILLELTDTGRARLLTFSDTVLELFDPCSTSMTSAQNP